MMLYIEYVSFFDVSPHSGDINVGWHAGLLFGSYAQNAHIDLFAAKKKRIVNMRLNLLFVWIFHAGFFPLPIGNL
jgi:hypothetical protein